MHRQFDEPDNFYLVKSGEAAVVKYKKVASGSSEEREEEVVRVYQKGDYFGEISIIKNQTRTATIKAKGDCTVSSYPDSCVFFKCGWVQYAHEDCPGLSFRCLAVHYGACG